ncbi:MAG: transposase [Candidatus Brocadiales bacterium]|nr:transposase [Candidatus Brocadiales bacterium]
MSNYRRANAKGGTYFFTVVTYRRQEFLCNENVRTALRDGISDVQTKHPFTIDGWVLLPNHLHCIWTLPEHDSNFGIRWAMIKRFITKRCGPDLRRDDWMNASKRKRNESTIWQRRFWEHMIRDEDDFNKHLNYIHFNPVKHGLVTCVKDWPHSTFHRCVREGIYPPDWGGDGTYDTNDKDYGE